jgi:hypothetical protein
VLPKRPLSVDGVAQRQRRLQQPTPQQAAQAPSRKDFRPPPQPEPKKTFLGKFQLPLIIVAGIAMGVLVQSVAMGQIIILAYGVVAIVLRVESRTTFVLALLAIITTVTMSLSQPNSAMGKNFATYAFLLLLVGIVSAAIESIQQRNLLARKRGVERLRSRKKQRA